MACYSSVTIPVEIAAMNPTTEEKEEVLKRMRISVYYNIDYTISRCMSKEQVAQFKRELNAVRAIATAKQQGYKVINETRVGNRIQIRCMD